MDIILIWRFCLIFLLKLIFLLFGCCMIVGFLLGIVYFLFLLIVSVGRWNVMIVLKKISIFVFMVWISCVVIFMIRKSCLLLFVICNWLCFCIGWFGSWFCFILKMFLYGLFIMVLILKFFSCFWYWLVCWMIFESLFWELLVFGMNVRDWLNLYNLLIWLLMIFRLFWWVWVKYKFRFCFLVFRVLNVWRVYRFWLNFMVGLWCIVILFFRIIFWVLILRFWFVVCLLWFIVLEVVWKW